MRFEERPAEVYAVEVRAFCDCGEEIVFSSQYYPRGRICPTCKKHETLHRSYPYFDVRVREIPEPEPKTYTVTCPRGHTHGVVDPQRDGFRTYSCPTCKMMFDVNWELHK